MIIAGEKGKLMGDFWEWKQSLQGKSSGEQPQDYYSNRLGYEFYSSPYGQPTYLHRSPLPPVAPPIVVNDFADHIYNFLKH